ncbi:unnamed protein product, partial [Vitis vinifera]
MDSRLFSLLRQSIQQYPQSLIRKNPISNRTYYTSRYGKISLYNKISPLGDPNTSVVPELDNWVQNGNKVWVAELQRIIHDLRKRKRFSQALEISEWMSKKGICAFSPTEHAVQLDLIGRVRGFLSAESYFNSLQNHDKTDKTYGALLNCYVRQRQTDKSLSHLQKMKEMGFASSPLTYNDIMCLYTNVGQHEKVPDVLTEMKQSNVYPDNFSYRICINSYGAQSDIQGMENVLKEMERQPHIRDGLGYNHLISLYASLGNKAEVLRLWSLEKNVEAFVGSLRIVIPMNRRMYHTLIMANIRAGKEVDGLLASMKADKIVEDEETKKILGTKQNKI